MASLKIAVHLWLVNIAAQNQANAWLILSLPPTKATHLWPPTSMAGQQA